MLNFLFTQTPLKFFIQSLWRDEAFTYLLSIKSLPEITNLTAKDFNPPLYYWFMHVWIKLFGQSEIVLRLPSLIFFCATIYIVYLILTEIFKIKWKLAFLLLIFFVINPSLHYYAFEARMYSMAVFLVTLSYYALFKKKWRLYYLAIILGLYTHYFVVFPIIAQLIGNWIIYRDFKLIKPFIRYLVFIFLVWLPWIIYVSITHHTPPQSFWISPPKIFSWLNLPAIIFSGFENEKILRMLLWQFNFVLVSFIVISFFSYWEKIGLQKKLQTEQSLLIHLLLWSFLPPLILLVISLFYPLFLPRYFLYCTVGLSLLLIKLMRCSSKWLTAIFIIILLFYTIRFSNQQVTLRTKVNLHKTIASIKKISRPNDLLFVDHEFNYHVAQYYFPANRVFILGKTYEEIPVYMGKILIPENAIVTQLPIYPDRAFLLKENGTYSIISQE